jgi:hypothetical protein
LVIEDQRTGSSPPRTRSETTAPRRREQAVAVAANLQQVGLGSAEAARNDIWLPGMDSNPQILNLLKTL